MLDFSFLKDDGKTRLVIVGERDDYGPVEEIVKMVGRMNPPPPVIIIPGADHFFSGSTEELARALDISEPRIRGSFAGGLFIDRRGTFPKFSG